MNTHPNDEILGSLRAARRRMRLQYGLEQAVRWTLGAGLGLLLTGAARRWLLGLEPWGVWGALVALGLALLGALLVTLLQKVPLTEAARRLDQLGQTRDRFLTALRFSDAPNPFQALALEECRAFLRREDFSRRIALRWPREARYLAVPLVALGLLSWENQLSAGARRLATEAAQKAVEPTVRQLDALARDLEQAHDLSRDEELRRIAEQLKKSARELRAENQGSEEAAKAALRELTALEQLLGQMQKAPGSPSPQELEQLAKALDQSDATKQAAQAMAAGQLAEAAQQLEAAAQQPGPEEAEKILREALQRLAEQQKASAALQELAKKIQQAGGEGGQSLQQLAQMLRKMAEQGGSPGKSGQPSSQQAMKNLLSALQNLKFGEGNQPPQSGQDPGQGDGGKEPITVQAFGVAPGAEPPPANSLQVPSGQPGSERDAGTTETPLGTETAQRAERGVDGSLKGRLAEGESLSQLQSTAGDSSKSQRRYKELYEAMAPAAEAAVQQENIPLGSRFFVKRYFESIRPKE